MAKYLCFFFFTLITFSTSAIAQGSEKKNQNLSKKQFFYYDPGTKLKIESTGYYYVDDLGETTDRHGRWTFFNKNGEKVEVRNYNRNKLEGEVMRFYPGEKIKDVGYFKEDLQDSLYISFSLKGDTAELGHYNEGIPTGVWKYFYEDGSLKSVEEIIDSTSYVWEFYAADSTHEQTVIKGNGTAIVYFENGNVKSLYNYKDGLKDGEFEEGAVYGYPQLKGAFLANKPTGKWEYYFYSGDLEKVVHYKDGVIDGQYINYYDNGKTRVEGQYEMGEKTGKWTWYTNSGIIDMQGDFKNDLQHGSWIYNYTDGSISYKAKYKLGKKEGKWTYYYKNGKKFKVGTFSNDLKDGTWTTWYEDGTLLMEGDYKADKEEGVWKNYWENGQLKNQSTFKNGKLNGEWQSYYDNGTPLTNGSYDMGFKTGKWEKYFPNGMTSDINHYKVIKKKSKIKYGIFKDKEEPISVKNGLSVTYSQKDFRKMEEGKYKNDNKDGKWTTYHPGGEIPAVITNYKNGKLNGKMQTFEFKGQKIISDIEYKNGLKHGKTRIYDRDGKVINEMEFKEGIQVIHGTKSGVQFTPGR